jgi:sarcosine oxidase subunit delta
MKLVPCPLNGPRPLEEFLYGGEWRATPSPLPMDDAAWARHVYDRLGIPAARREWWYHLPSGYWFIAERDTLSGEFLRTYDAAALSKAAS